MADQTKERIWAQQTSVETVVEAKTVKVEALVVPGGRAKMVSARRMESAKQVEQTKLEIARTTAATVETESERVKLETVRRMELKVVRVLRKDNSKALFSARGMANVKVAAPTKPEIRRRTVK